MHGGARAGGGRPKGSKNKRTVAALVEASAEGLLPVQYKADRQWAAHAAAQAAGNTIGRSWVDYSRNDPLNDLSLGI